MKRYVFKTFLTFFTILIFGQLFAANNPAATISHFAINNHDGIINQDTGTISVLLPASTNLKGKFKAVFYTNGQLVIANDETQKSGVTENTYPLKYTVVGFDNSLKHYNVIIQTESSKELLSFKLGPPCNAVAKILRDVILIPNQPYDKACIVEFVTNGKKLIYKNVNKIDVEQISGVTQFKNPSKYMQYSVQAINGSTNNYTLHQESDYLPYPDPEQISKCRLQKTSCIDLANRKGESPERCDRLYYDCLMGR